MPFVNTIAFYFDHNCFDLNTVHLPELQQAIFDKHPVQLVYRNWNSSEVRERVIEPFRLTYNTRAWYVTAYCRLRRAVRSFRLERIERLHILPETFTADHTEPFSEPPTVEVHVRFDESILRQVREVQHYGFLAEPETGLMVYRVHTLDEIQSWLFGWGARAEVLKPDELRRFIYDEAKKLIALLT